MKIAFHIRNMCSTKATARMISCIHIPGTVPVHCSVLVMSRWPLAEASRCRCCEVGVPSALGSYIADVWVLYCKAGTVYLALVSTVDPNEGHSNFSDKHTVPAFLPEYQAAQRKGGYSLQELLFTCRDFIDQTSFAYNRSQTTFLIKTRLDKGFRSVGALSMPLLISVSHTFLTIYSYGSQNQQLTRSQLQHFSEARMICLCWPQRGCPDVQGLQPVRDCLETDVLAYIFWK